MYVCAGCGIPQCWFRRFGLHLEAGRRPFSERRDALIVYSLLLLYKHSTSLRGRQVVWHEGITASTTILQSLYARFVPTTSYTYTCRVANAGVTSALARPPKPNAQTLSIIIHVLWKKDGVADKDSGARSVVVGWLSPRAASRRRMGAAGFDEARIFVHSFGYVVDGATSSQCRLVPSGVLLGEGKAG